MTRPIIASYILAVVATLLVLYLHLLPAVIAGLAVHVMTSWLAARLPATWSGKAQRTAVIIFALLVALILLGAGLGLWSFLRDNDLSSLLNSAAGALDNVRRTLPPQYTQAIPSSVDDLRQQVSTLMRQHGSRLTQVGMEGVRGTAHILIGMILGGVVSLHRFKEAGAPPFSRALHDRLSFLNESFAKVLFAQVTISLLNTALTAIYLFAILPLFGIQLPMRMVLVAITFICGLLPVVGNLISNVVIVLISVGTSPMAGLGSVIFLLAIHKLEYFTNAKIVGGRVHAESWELLCSMVLFEAMFGLTGLIAAPFLYAWLKAELTATGMVS
ncbi:AI-2E family transporter [Geomesophilobacter sediminis]|uniref:AI-2E family transporter n=1 Tax=Geomesophilobacter sediminis TaxID=2798584 RepID=A0A8J7JCB5_9BACT|nr:AI-2E family transporter [Geomesophilobacter sediminis]MBJ6724971.1 AI-2E family transporter [Geomesophilobacter sediminis]